MWTIVTEACNFPDGTEVRKEKGEFYYTLRKNGIDLYDQSGTPLKYAPGMFILQSSRSLNAISADKRLAMDFTNAEDFLEEAEILTSTERNQ